jgi:hypothetical protein
MGRIFLSYRRDDSAGYVRAVRTDMTHRFGGRHVFLDVEDIEAGSDFVDVIEKAVGHCEALVAFIGPNWLKATNDAGLRRLDEPHDFVRLEIASALRRDVRVIPVLVGDQEMPSGDDLPDDLKPLARVQGISLSNDRWDDDLNRLYRALERATDELKLAQQYAEALDCQERGLWREALQRFQTITTAKPGYADVAEKMKPLCALAEETAVLGPARGGWQKAVYRFPLSSMLAVGAVSNGAAALFNFYYNWQTIVMPMQRRGLLQAEYLFQAAAVLVNSIGFAVGILSFAYLALPVVRILQSLQNGLAMSGPGLAAGRERCLSLGHYAALIGIGLWAVVGPIYPLSMGALELRDYLSFAVSLALCGIIAAIYPFLGITWLCVRVFYLPMLPEGSTQPADDTLIRRVERWNWRYLLLAGILPMLAITLVLMLNSLSPSGVHSNLLGVLGLGGVGGFLLAIRLFQMIQGDLAVLKGLVERSTGARPVS